MKYFGFASLSTILLILSLAAGKSSVYDMSHTEVSSPLESSRLHLHFLPIPQPCRSPPLVAYPPHPHEWSTLIISVRIPNPFLGSKRTVHRASILAFNRVIYGRPSYPYQRMSAGEVRYVIGNQDQRVLGERDRYVNQLSLPDTICRLSVLFCR